MALSRLSLALSFALLSLLAIASASDYSDDSSKYGFSGTPANSPQAKPEGEVKPNYGANRDTYKPKPEEKEKSDYSKTPYVVKPKPEEKEKPDYSKQPYVVKPKSEGKETSNYGAKQESYKPKPEEKEKSDYKKTPYVVKSKPEGEEKSNYGTKQDTYKPKPEEKEKYGYNRNSYVVKPTPVEEKHYYGSKPDNYKQENPEEKPEYERKQYVVKPESKGDEKPSYGTKPEEMKNRLSIAVQGLVLCKTSSEYYPIQGAFTTIRCKAVDEVGVEKNISICSKPTDAKGYFFATLSDSNCDKLKLKECRAYLKSSPLKTCDVPTNVNKGTEGAPLSSFRVLRDKRTKLYSVRPFFYTSQAKPAPKYGY